MGGKKGQTKICPCCEKPFKLTDYHNGKKVYLHHRTYCMQCSPYGVGNSKHLALRTAEEKVCTACEKLKPISEFFRRRRGDYKAVCKTCHGQDGLARRRQYKFDAVTYKGGKCEHCDYDRHPCAMDFHHLDPTEKEFGIGKKLRPLDKIKPELDKCLLLCSNCHRAEHLRVREERDASDQGVVVEGGTPCTNCGLARDDSEYTYSKGRRHPWCRTCKRKYTNARLREIKKEIIEYKGGVCVKCGYDDSPAAFDLHHPDPSEKDVGPAVFQQRLAKVKDEVDKCVLLCSNCHREEHHAEG